MTEEQIVGRLARTMTGHVAARCCHITGGLQTQHTHPNCSCREFAHEVVALLGPAPLEWGPDRTMPSRLAAEIGEWGEYVISEVGDADDPRYSCRAWLSTRFSYVISSSEGLPWHRTESAAKAAAEAHYRAAWWAQTVAARE